MKTKPSTRTMRSIRIPYTIGCMRSGGYLPLWMVLGAVLFWGGRVDFIGAAAAQTAERDATAVPEPAAPPGRTDPVLTVQRSGDPDAFSTRDEQVKEHVARARRAFQERQFDRSIQDLQLAYELVPKPLYLFNIAQCHRRAGRQHQALGFYQRFLREEPSHPTPQTRLEATTYVTELRTLMREHELLEREQHRPLRKKAWFWGVLASATVATGLALGVGLGVGLRDPRQTIHVSWEALRQPSPGESQAGQQQ